MSLEEFLKDKKQAIVKRWFGCVMDTYPADARRFLTKEKDRFSNPVGGTIAAQMEILYDGLTAGIETEDQRNCLDEIIRIRAVQDMEPSKAVGFVLELRGIVREELEKEGALSRFPEERRRFENRIDDAALAAFDIYSRRRQKINDLRVNEVRNQVGKLLQRAGLVYEIPELAPDRNND
jgi:hypothetical protein